MHGPRRSVYPTVVAAILLTIAAPVAAQDTTGNAGHIYLPLTMANQVPQEPAGDPAAMRVVAVDSVAPDADAAALAFWTADRMAVAQPIDAASLAPPETVAGRDQDEPVAGGAAPSYAGLPGAAAMAATAYPADWAAAAAIDERTAVEAAPGVAVEGIDAWGVSPPFTSYYVNDDAGLWKAFPWRTFGRIFFNKPTTPGNFSCSGAVSVGRAVWTAGHCIYTPGEGFNTNMVFVPAYRNYARPYGTFAVVRRATLQGWTLGKPAYDIGMVVVGDVNGLKVSEWVGNLGFRYNAAATQLYHFAGYPNNIGKSQYLIACSTVTNRREALDGPDAVGIGCDMTGGADGAPGLVAFAPNKSGAVNYANTVFSHVSSTAPNQIYGAYFDIGAKGLYDWARSQ